MERTNTQTTQRSDIWSLGILLYECFAGAHPFEPLPTSLDLNEWMKRLCRGINTEIPEEYGNELRQQVHECLIVDPDQRLVQIQDLVEAIHRAISSPVIHNDVAAEHLTLTYLKRLAAQIERVRLPIPDEQIKEVALLGKLFVDLPLIIEHEVEERHERERSKGHIGFAAQIEHRADQDRNRNKGKRCLLESRLVARRSAVIVGQPGCGKSTLFASYVLQLIYTELRRIERSEKPDGPITKSPENVPIMLVSRNLVALRATTFRAFLLGQLEHMGFPSNEQVILADYLLKLQGWGKATAFVDGLDEMPTVEGRRRYCQVLAEHALVSPSGLYATSRVVGFNAVKDIFCWFDLLMVDTLEITQQNRYLDKWCDFDARADKKDLSRQILENPRLAHLRETMLMFALLVQMCSLDGHLPLRRVDVFHQLMHLTRATALRKHRISAKC